jgi:hypothetical protein
LVAVLGLLAACEQSEGQPCQADGDCEDGLECQELLEGRGVCQSPGGMDAGTDEGDASEPPVPLMDGGPDASVDAGADAAADSGGMAPPDGGMGGDSDSGSDADGG